MRSSYLVLEADRRRYGISAEFALYVEERGDGFARLPGARPPLAGLLVSRGEVLPVLSFNRLVGAESQAETDPRFVVVSVEGRKAALSVDRTRQFVVIDLKRVFDPPPEAQVRGPLRISGVAGDKDPLLLIDGHSIFQFEGETT